MGKWAQGKFTPKNAHKYIGKRTPVFRSSWELALFNFCDEHPSVMQWASESMAIPYRCPFTGKTARYIPDLFIIYVDQDGAQQVEVVEIKPAKETGMKPTKNRRDALVALKNQAKWASARAYCERQGFTFRVLTEDNIFRTKGSL